VLAREISDIFLQGVRGRAASHWTPAFTEAQAGDTVDEAPRKRSRKRS